MTTAAEQRERRATEASGDPIVQLLIRAYLMEMETVANYLAASANLDGIRAQEVARSLAADVAEELGHARRLAERLKQLDALVPGSQGLEAVQASLQPDARRTDVARVVRGVLDAEEAAIAHYRELITEAAGFDWVTQDLAISILGDEEAHRRLFRSYLREYEDGTTCEGGHRASAGGTNPERPSESDAEDGVST